MKRYAPYVIGFAMALLATAGGSVLAVATQYAWVIAVGVDWHCRQDEGARLELRAAVAREIEARGKHHTARIDCDG